DPDVQQHFVEGHDGTQLYVETWLPAEKDGKVPPKKIPTILIMTPYVSQGVEEYPGEPSFIEYFNARGFAVAQHHVRGTGESGGCLEQTSSDQIKDGAAVVEYLGKEAPWSNGRVGMYGASYDAETQISTAAFGEPAKIKYLKAIVPTASVGGQYDWNFMDGVPWAGQPALGNSSYLAGTSLVPGQIPAPQHYPEKLECQGEVMLSSADQNGDFTEYWQEREYRPRAHKVRAATLMVHGLRDFNVQDITLQGFFNRLPESTPHKGLFGVWNHAFPSSHGSVEPAWNRGDWYDMVTAWFDRYLKGRDTDVEQWPDVQVQSSAGEWWAVEEYPNTGGPLGQLALGPDGTLGLTSPEGETTYTEQVAVGEPGDGQSAVFETPKVKAPLHLTGQPMLDLWLMSSRPDGHVAAKLEVIGSDGSPLRHQGGSAEYHATYGVRSLQHIDPMPNGWFEQEAGKEIATNEPVKVTVRFLPTDLVVPAGGSLRLTISGSVSYSKGDSLPSAAASDITLLHHCSRFSALRFRMPQKKARLLNVRETDELDTPKLASSNARVGVRNGGGLATARICGQRPRPLPFI
ncbi:MAG: CocE/NonD family hydrolase, partial [Actinomycetota bacterium]|nr:CocE/NonD family hydrolase [Actinomycetota bacterium]